MFFNLWSHNCMYSIFAQLNTKWSQSNTTTHSTLSRTAKQLLRLLQSSRKSCRSSSASGLSLVSVFGCFFCFFGGGCFLNINASAPSWLCCWALSRVHAAALTHSWSRSSRMMYSSCCFSSVWETCVSARLCWRALFCDTASDSWTSRRRTSSSR